MIKKKSPLVSILFLSYCQENYVGESLKSILEIDYDNVEVLVSDDASTDSTLEIIKNILADYSGDKKIVLLDNQVNLGLVPNFNKCLSLSQGEYIAVAAGDDISFPSRVKDAIYHLEKGLDLSMVSFSDYEIDSQGQVKKDNMSFSNKSYNLYSLIDNKKVRVSGASRVFRRSVYDFFGPLKNNCPTEDTTFMLRALMLGEVLVLSKPGIYYRVHESSLSSYDALYRMSFDDIYSQYISDVITGYEKGIIKSPEFLNLIKWVSSIKKCRDLDRLVYTNKGKPFTLLRLFFCKGVYFKYKVSTFMKHYVRN